MRFHAAASPSFRDEIVTMLLGEKRLALRIAVLALFGALLALVPPEVSRLAIDEALPKAAPRTLVVLSLTTLLVGLHQAWAGFLEDRASTLLRARTERQALVKLMTAILLPRRNGKLSQGVGALNETLGAAGEVVDVFVGALASLLIQGCFALTYLGLLLYSAPSAAFAVILITGIFSLVSWLCLPRELNTLRRSLQKRSEQSQWLHDLLSSLSSLRGLHITDRLSRRWNAMLESSAVAEIEHCTAGLRRSTFLEAGSKALQLGVLCWVAYRCIENNIGIGEMVLLTGVAGGLSSSLLSLNEGLTAIHRLQPQFERIDEVFSMAAAVPSPIRALALATEKTPTIAAKGVCHRYSQSERWILQDRNFELQQGSVLHLQSPSGSGKSTLLRIVAGLIAPTAGEVTIQGVAAVDARRRILYVPQYCGLFEASILENLQLLSGASHRRIEEVARLTGLDTLLQGFPMGMETPVAAEGENLSSGQRQMIILTAAFASDRSIILLDEATSQVDEQTRTAIAWQELLRERTAIIVDHHLQLAFPHGAPSITR